MLFNAFALLVTIFGGHLVPTVDRSLPGSFPDAYAKGKVFAWVVAFWPSFVPLMPDDGHVFVMRPSYLSRGGHSVPCSL